MTVSLPCTRGARQACSGRAPKSRVTVSCTALGARPAPRPQAVRLTLVMSMPPAAAASERAARQAMRLLRRRSPHAEHHMTYPVHELRRGAVVADGLDVVDVAPAGQSCWEQVGERL